MQVRNPVQAIGDESAAAPCLETRVVRNFYVDSIVLAKLVSSLNTLEGVRTANVAMGTPFQHDELDRAGLTDDLTRTAGPNDLIVSILASSPADAALARLHVDDALRRRQAAQADHTATVARTVTQAARRRPEASVAFISVPGQYAASEAHQALARGLTPVIFSDHVSLSDEVALKARASAEGLIVMGPDCGTALLGGLGLGFVNDVPAGRIGIVAASGTGAQAVSVLIARSGEGISHILGVGGRDLSAEVAGRSTLDSIELLARDRRTEVIVVVAKQPAEVLVPRIMDALDRSEKPWAALLLGSGVTDRRCYSTLAGVADAAVALARSEDPPSERRPVTPANGNGVFAAFQGGTIAAEARYLLGPQAQINDFGAEEFTTQSPHPIIDPSRRDRAIAEVATHDPNVSVVLADLVLGHGGHADPAPGLAAALLEARSRSGRDVAGHVHVVGTATDFQNLGRSEDLLRDAGWRVHPSTTAAALASTS